MNDLEQFAAKEYSKISMMRKVWTWPEGFVAGFKAAYENKEIMSRFLHEQRMEQERNKFIKVLESCLNDVEYAEHATKRYLEVGRPKQDVIKTGTPMRAIAVKIRQSLKDLTHETT